MSQKYVMMYSEYDENTGNSIVRINTPIGAFEGTAKVHPEQELPSRFLGCEISEMRAIIKYWRKMAQIEKGKLKEVKSLYKECSDRTTEFNANDYYCVKMRKRIEKIENKIKSIEMEAQKLEIYIDMRIKSFEDSVAAMKRHEAKSKI